MIGLIAVFGFSLRANASATLGSVTGVVRDSQTGNPLRGATVVATSPQMPTGQTAITDSSGEFLITSLVPGNYTVTVFFSKSTVEHDNVLVGADKTVTLALKISVQVAERVVIHEKTPAIDTTSEKVGVTVGEDFANYLPLPRDISAMAAIAPGAAEDAVGLGIGGATGFENTYIIDGNDTTDVILGAQGTSLPPDFVQSIEVITGAYNAEYGHATGGIENVVTKSGSNDFHGEVFGYFRPYQAPINIIPTNGEATSYTDGLNYGAQPGFDVSGPIVKDKLFFFVGFSPLYDSFDFHRQFSSLQDNCNNVTRKCGSGMADGFADQGKDGFTLQQPVSPLDRNHSFVTYYFATKLNYQLDANNSGSISWYGNPENNDGYFGGGPGVGGTDASEHYAQQTGSQDVTARWTSKLFDRKFQIDAILGWHHQVADTSPYTQAGNTIQQNYIPLGGASYRPGQGFNGNAPFGIYDYSAGQAGSDYLNGQAYDGGPGSGRTCQDGSANDKYPLIQNCPLLGWSIGGLGFFDDVTTDRFSERLSFTNFFRAAGHHQLKYGLDFEQTRYDHYVGYTGGELDTFGQFTNDTTLGGVRTFGYQDPSSGQVITTPNYRDTSTGVDWAAFVQDSYEPLPNLTINAGLRVEQFTINGSPLPELQGMPTNTTAIAMPWTVAPRVGVIWDPTSEGKAKIFAHWGEYYENIPLDIADREFSGQTFAFRLYNISPGQPCTSTPHAPFDVKMSSCAMKPGFGGSASYGNVLPGLQPERQQEFVAGGQYELTEDMVVGAYYTHRSLDEIVEDVSNGVFAGDGSLSYALTNPGDWPSYNSLVSDYTNLLNKIKNEKKMPELAALDGQQAVALKSFIDNYNSVLTMPNPVRLYDAVTLTIDKAFSKSYYMVGSYTLSRLYGNYPGSYDGYNGQQDPNISSEFDLASLMFNRMGLLPNNAAHNFKLAGYYTLDLGQAAGYMIFGLNLSYITGNPETVLAGSPYQGYDFGSGTLETFVLPSGQLGTTPSIFQADGMVTYGRRYGKYHVEGFFGADNLFDEQTNLAFSQAYTPDATLPIINGDMSDLRYAKQMQAFNQSDPYHQEVLASSSSNMALAATAPQMAVMTLQKLPTFQQPIARQLPLVVRMGFRLYF